MWVASECLDSDWLLSGQSLKNALAWATDKSLDDLDYRFLNYSQEAEKLKVQAALATEKEANRKAKQIIEAANRKAERIVFIGKLSLVSLLSLGFSGLWYGKSLLTEKTDRLSKAEAELRDAPAFVQGEMFRLRHQYEESIQVFDSIIGRSPNGSENVRLFARRGDAYRAIGQYDKAVEDLDSAFSQQLGYESSFAFDKLQLLYDELTNNVRALESILDDTDESSEKPIDNYKRALAYRQLGNFEEALHEVELAIKNSYVKSDGSSEQSAQKAWSYLNKGYILFGLGNKKEALENLAKVTLEDPFILPYRSSLYSLMNERRKALDDINKAIELTFDMDGSMYFKRAELYEGQEDFEEALEDLDKSVEYSINPIQALLKRASINSELDSEKSYEEAIADLGRIIAHPDAREKDIEEAAIKKKNIEEQLKKKRNQRRSAETQRLCKREDIC